MLGASAVIAATGLPSLEYYPDFNPKREYGNCLKIHGRFHKKWALVEARRAKEILIENLKKVVPRQYRRNVRLFAKQYDYGWVVVFGWLYRPNNDFSDIPKGQLL